MFAITTLSVNNRKTRMSQPQILKLKMIPINSLLLTTFKIRWLLVGGLAEDLLVSNWLVVGSW